MPSKTTNKFIVLDRDGTIIEDTGYVHKISDLKFLPKAIVGLKKLQNLGYKFIIITNQAGIARGLYTLEQTEKFNQELSTRLAKKGIAIEKIYVCPHHPEFTGVCICRKPEVGLAKLAEKEFNINLKEAIFIGDKDSDIELGKNCGGITILLDNGQYKTKSTPHYKAKNLLEATQIISKN